MPEFQAYLKSSVKVLEDTLNDQQLAKSLEEAIKVTLNCLSHRRAFLVCGNGGSASDAQHITGELVGRYLKEREALNVICLSDNAAVLTALGNDYGYETVFSRQVEAYGSDKGVILGLSTSGNSLNVVNAFIQAKKMNITTIAMTGQGGGKLAAHTDILIAAPSKMTPLIQQVHIALYHYFCQEIEKRIVDLRG
ncbi:MAG: SIS domain-containing protein [Alphaproteobacteria bacterium]|jgi:D-sedoheptulose 7-phosphate isomerase|nr:SIS domain-containing protein [Alphaproteobacteria bacterium]